MLSPLLGANLQVPGSIPGRSDYSEFVLEWLEQLGVSVSPNTTSLGSGGDLVRPTGLTNGDSVIGNLTFRLRLKVPTVLKVKITVQSNLSR